MAKDVKVTEEHFSGYINGLPAEGTMRRVEYTHPDPNEELAEFLWEHKGKIALGAVAIGIIAALASKK